MVEVYKHENQLDSGQSRTVYCPAEQGDKNEETFSFEARALFCNRRVSCPTSTTKTHGLTLSVEWITFCARCVCFQQQHQAELSR
jgi:hypothetical protein